MSWEAFWNGPPELAPAYRRAEEYRLRRREQELWRLGLYFQRAVASVLSERVRYPGEPFPVTKGEAEEQRGRQEAVRLEEEKAKMTQWVEAFRRKKEGEAHGREPGNAD